MVEVDPVILQLRADVNRYRAELLTTTRLVDRSLGNQERAVQSLERQFKQSSAQIGGTLKGLAGTIAGAFSVQQITRLADGYTQFTNQLKVAGLEGARLGDVQESLFNIAQRYGTELESLGGLYSRAAGAQKELGATSAQLVQFTEGVAAGLRVQGATAQSASGALQQLGQLLGSSRVQAEEFNSIIDGARPILQAVANNIDAAGGSVSRLKALVNDGKLTNVQFFNAFLKGSQQLQEQASSAQLTIGNSFTILNNALGKYIGEADRSLSATEKLSQAIITLSENLDTVASAAAVIGAVLLGRYVAGMAAAATGTGVLSTALLALQARAAGAATTLEAAALAGTTAGRALLAAFGGPVGVAVAALTIGIGYLVTRTEEGAQASSAYKATLDASSAAMKGARDAADQLATATGKARAEALEHARAKQTETAALLRNAKAKLEDARAGAVIALEEARRRRATARAGSATVSGLGGASASSAILGVGSPSADQAIADFNAAQQAVYNLAGALNEISGAIAAPPYVPLPPLDEKKKKPKKDRSRDPADVARQVADELARGSAEYSSINAELINSIEARRDAEVLRANTEAAITSRSIVADKDLTDAQKRSLLSLNEQIRASRIELAKAEELDQLNTEQANILTAQLRNQQDAVAAQADLATTAAERRDLELRLIDLQEREERARLAAILAFDSRASREEKMAALGQYQTVGQRYDAAREGVRRSTQGPLESLFDQVPDTAAEMNEALEGVAANGLASVTDGLTEAGARFVKLGGIAGDVVNGIIRDLMRLAAQQLVLGGGIGDAVSAIGSLFGGFFANGGVPPRGKVSVVGERGPELLVGDGRARVVPMAKAIRPVAGNVQPARPQFTVVAPQQFDLRGAVVTRELLAQFDERARAHAAVAASAMGRNVLQAVPGRLSQFQSDGT